MAGSYGGYDWGSEEKNLLHHGSPVPPSYSLKNVTAKVSPKFFLAEITLRQVALVWGDNDVLVEPEDLKRIKDEVPNIVMNFKASYTCNVCIVCIAYTVFKSMFKSSSCNPIPITNLTSMFLVHY